MRLFRGRDAMSMPDRERLLKAYPVRNQAVEWEDEVERIHVTIPRATGLKARLLSILFYVPKKRVLELDEIGSEVVRRCDGKTTVRQIADHLASKLGLNRREAEAALLDYLKMLVRRGVIGVAIPGKQKRER